MFVLRHKLNLILGIICLMLLGLVIIVFFMDVSEPQTETVVLVDEQLTEIQKLDLNRAQDLLAIEQSLSDYWQSHQQFPSNLEDYQNILDLVDWQYYQPEVIGYNFKSLTVNDLSRQSPLVLDDIHIWADYSCRWPVLMTTTAAEGQYVYETDLNRYLKPDTGKLAIIYRLQADKQQWRCGLDQLQIVNL